MATITELRARLAALEALPAGVKQVQMGGQMVTFRTFEEVSREKQRILAEIRALERRPKGSTIWGRGGLD